MEILYNVFVKYKVFLVKKMFPIVASHKISALVLNRLGAYKIVDQNILKFANYY